MDGMTRLPAPMPRTGLRRYMLSPQALIDGFHPSDCIVLDVDTTGLSPADEILRVVGVDGFGRPVINQFFRPERHEYWDSATAVNGITPAMIANAPFFRPNIGGLANFFHCYKCIIGYGIGFDLKMLSASGLSLTGGWRIVDVKNIYALVAGGGFKAPLTTAAARFGYRMRNDGFDAPAMTLFVLEWLMYEAVRSGHTLDELIARSEGGGGVLP